MINILTQQCSCEIHMNLCEFSELNSFAKTLESIISIHRTDVINISLKPPIQPKCSIPLAFQRIISIAQKTNIKNISFNCYINPELEDYLVKYLPDSSKPKQDFIFGNIKVSISVGDILNSDSEAIINPSNKNLRLGGGVSGSIRKAANPGLEQKLEEIKNFNEINDGDAILTDSFGVGKARYLLHLATDTGIPEIVKLGIRNALIAASEYQIKSITFPAIATGAGGMKIDNFAGLFKNVLTELINHRKIENLELINIFLFKLSDYQHFVKYFEKPINS